MRHERRRHRRYRVADLTAMVQVPESSLDFYFHADNLSLSGLALLTRNTEGFPIEPDSVVDLEIYTHHGPVVCRGHVARLIPGPDGRAIGFGVEVYGFTSLGEERWHRLLAEAEAAADTNEEA